MMLIVTGRSSLYNDQVQASYDPYTQRPS